MTTLEMEVEQLQETVSRLQQMVHTAQEVVGQLRAAEVMRVEREHGGWLPPKGFDA